MPYQFRGLIDLGPLERRVLDAFHDQHPHGADVRHLLETTFPGRPYTTLMTTVHRLWAKHLLTRERNGRNFIYRVAMTRSELIAASAIVALQSGVQIESTGQLAGVLTDFINQLERVNPDVPDIVRGIVNAKRPGAS